MKKIGILILMGWIEWCGAAVPLSVHPLFSEHAVLQRDLPLPIFGEAAPGSPVKIEFAGARGGTVADAQGRWEVVFPALTAGGPYVMRVSSNTESLSVEDLWVGEVWLCSGQSNMEWVVVNAMNAEREIASANEPMIRHFKVKKMPSPIPLQRVEGVWEVASPQTVGYFTAVGYYFARELHRRLGVPIGLVNSTWGGTLAESWMNLKALEKDPNFKPILERNQKEVETYPERLQKYQAALPIWKAKFDELWASSEREAQGWSRAQFDDAGWEMISLPRHLEKYLKRDWDGAFWLRRSVMIPNSWEGQEVDLMLGKIDDFDQTYWDGIKLGETGPTVANAGQQSRVYRIKGVTAGLHQIAIRVVDQDRQGGVAPNQEIRLQRVDGNGLISLAGAWKLRLEQELTPRRPQEPLLPEKNPNRAGNLYHGMIHPLIPVSFRGVIWYQGESNAGRGYQYRQLFPALIENWRAEWGRSFPFYYVQLANFENNGFWPEVREAQQMTLRVPGTGMVVTTDIGDPEDIHPRNKQEVGRRLALIARKRTYGEKDLVDSGPIYSGMQIEGKRIRLKFSSVGSGLQLKRGQGSAFEVAGEDRQFRPAEAWVSGDTVTVVAAGVPFPKAARYGWSNSPESTLSNREGLPASPFRTDDWPGVTAEKR